MNYFMLISAALAAVSGITMAIAKRRKANKAKASKKGNTSK